MALGLSATKAGAQTLADKLTSRTEQRTDGKKERLLVEARELVYNQDKNIVSAVGNVQLYYQGRLLEADKVTYDRNTNRVYAEGNAKLTDETGGVTYADRFDLTDDFKNGFIDGVNSVTKDKTRFSAARVERVDGDVSTFERGVYTACEPCKDKPERPPFWQVKASRIIHRNQEQMVYYEDARLELWGVPIAYLPYFSAPDPSVSRKTGFLAPHFVSSTSVGRGPAIPFFWNIAPNYDLTITPTLLSRQGLLGNVEWRHRQMYGSYNVRVSGIFQREPSAFKDEPLGPGSREWRGSIESTGKYFISDKWKFGWDVAILSDRWFFQDYKAVSDSVTYNNFIKESISTVYLNGQGDRGYFDLRGYYIRGLSTYDLQRQQPIVRPVWDYNKTIDLPAAKTGIGGQLEIDVNLTSMSRDIAAYQAVGRHVLDQGLGLYDVCEFNSPRVNIYAPSKCFLRGVGGDYTRLSAQASWKRKFIDPIGQVWTPFAFARVDAAWLSLNTSRSFTAANTYAYSTIFNSDQTNFLSGNQDFVGKVMPGIGLEYRYPFIARTSFANQTFEPIAQIIVRPNERKTYALPNEDAQSLVFDDTNIFEWNKFSGYDRTEGGARANLGAQYTAAFPNGGSLNILAGQSFQLWGRNSYAVGDVANTGINSGLENARSDYVGRISFSPFTNLSISARGRFDEKDFGLRRLDVMATATFGRLTTSLQYARYAAQPEIGYDLRREGIYGYAKYNINDNYWVSASATIDLDRHLADKYYGTKTSVFYPAVLGFGVGYQDECTILSVNYSNTLVDSYSNTRTRSQVVLFKLELKTLGEIKFKGGLSETRTADAIGSQTPAVQ